MPEADGCHVSWSSLHGPLLRKSRPDDVTEQSSCLRPRVSARTRGGLRVGTMRSPPAFFFPVHVIGRTELGGIGYALIFESCGDLATPLSPYGDM